jgi:hypothetical protein
MLTLARLVHLSGPPHRSVTCCIDTSENKSGKAKSGFHRVLLAENKHKWAACNISVVYMSQGYASLIEDAEVQRGIGTAPQRVPPATNIVTLITLVPDDHLLLS